MEQDKSRTRLEVHANTGANDGVVVVLVSPCVTSICEDAEAVGQTNVDATTSVQGAVGFTIGVNTAANESVRGDAGTEDWYAEHEASVESVHRAVGESPGCVDFYTDVAGEEVINSDTSASGVIDGVRTKECCSVEAELATRLEAVAAGRRWGDRTFAHGSFVHGGTSEADSGEGDRGEDCCSGVFHKLEIRETDDKRIWKEFKKK